MLKVMLTEVAHELINTINATTWADAGGYVGLATAPAVLLLLLLQLMCRTKSTDDTQTHNSNPPTEQPAAVSVEIEEAAPPQYNLLPKAAIRTATELTIAKDELFMKP